MTRTEVDAYDQGFLAALQVRSRIAKESLYRVAAAERKVKTLKRALLGSGIVSLISAATAWWLLLWWLAE